MKPNILSNFNELDAQLQSLPAEIAGEQEALTTVRQALSQDKLALDEIEAQLRMKCDGRNAEQRTAQLVQLKASHPGYRRRQELLESSQRRADTMQDTIDHLTRQYGATCYRARLLAGLMAYLAAANDLPVAATNNEVDDATLREIGL